jgi:hypothetical protein
MSDPFGNFKLNSNLMQKWIKGSSPATRRRKQASQEEGSESPLTPHMPVYPTRKSEAEERFDGKRQYIIGYIRQAKKAQLVELKTLIGLITPKNDIISKRIYKIIHSRKNNSTHNNNRKSKELITTLLRIYEPEGNSFVGDIYDILPPKY